MHRKQILENAISHTVGDRDVQYGSPEHNLNNVAMLWSAYISAKTGEPVLLSAQDVAWLNVLQKCGRTMTGEVSVDTYEDAAAYSAIAGELALRGNAPAEEND